MKLISFIALLFFLLIFLWIGQPWLAIIIGLLIIIYALTSLTVKTGRVFGRSAKKHASQIYADVDKNSPKSPDAMKTIDSSLKELGRRTKEFGYSGPNTAYKSPNLKLRIAKGLNSLIDAAKKLFKK